jgi:hypothetical protein
MIFKKKSIILCLLFFSYLILIYLKNYTFCDIYFGKCINEPYGGDLKRYSNHYYGNESIVTYYGYTLYIIFLKLGSWLDFKYFILIFQLTFYAVLFFCGLRLFKKHNLLKFNFFLLILLFFPTYEGYSSLALKQGMGMMFMLLQIFFVKRQLSIISLFLLLASIFSHFVFLIFYLIFYTSRYFSIKFLQIIFLVSILFYILGNNGFFFNLIVSFIEYFSSTLSNKTNLRISDDYNLTFVIFSLLPFLFYQISVFRKYINESFFIKKIYKFHLLYSFFIYLFFSNYYYINRFLEISWLFYPFYLLILFETTKLNFKNLKKIS